MNLPTPPSSIEAETHVLGAMMLDADALSLAVEQLEGADFYLNTYRQIFEAMKYLASEGRPVDAVSIEAFLQTQGKSQRIPIMGICSEVISAASIAEHCRIVKDKSLKRKQLQIVSWLHEAGFGEMDGREVQQELEKRVFALHDTDRVKGRLRPIRDVLAESFGAMARMQSGELVGLKTGLESLDEHMAGMHGGDLIVLAGRPGQGKTSIAAQIGIFNAENGKAVPFFECEMKDRAVVDRALFARAGISHLLFKHGKVPPSEFPKLAAASDSLKDIPFFINDSTGITPMQIRSQCRRLKKEKGLDLIVIDNIQRMKSDSGTSDIRVRTGEVSAALKEIAKEFDVPVLAVSHIRRMQNGEGTEPTLADLQESGNIEQDADIVLSLFNRSLYKQVEQDEEGKVKLTFLKFREGSLGYVDLYFEKELTTFMDWKNRPQRGFDPDAFTRGVK